MATAGTGDKVSSFLPSNDASWHANSDELKAIGARGGSWLSDKSPWGWLADPLRPQADLP